MEIIRGVSKLDEQYKGCVLTIGNFDGVHLGHRALIERLKEEAQRLVIPTMVMIFEPQPLEYFNAENAPSRLTSFRDKCRQLQKLGVDYLLCVRFDPIFAAMSAEKFVFELLVKKLAIQFLVVGDDFRFGAQRIGDILLLEKMSKRAKFSVVGTECFLNKEAHRYSSTLIRTALQKSDFAQSENLLGRPFTISGRVVHGNELGRTLGFPTANFSIKNRKTAIRGVYAVEVLGYGSSILQGVANIGLRPTIGGDSHSKLEVHILDFDENLYGEHLEVVFKQKLRNEQKFSSLDSLKEHIEKDIVMAKAFFKLGNL